MLESIKKGNWGDAWTSVKESSFGKAVGAAGEWAWNNRGNIAKGAAGVAFVVCTVGTAGACVPVAGTAFALSVGNRGINLAQSDKGGKDYLAFGSGVAIDTIGWRVNAVRQPAFFSPGSLPFLYNVSTRAGQARLYQQTSVLVWGTLGW